MRYIIPFSFDYISQLGILTTTIALLNIFLNTVLGIRKKYDELVDTYQNGCTGARKLPPDIEKLGRLNNKAYTEVFLWSFTSMIIIYIIIVVVANSIPYFKSIMQYQYNYVGEENYVALLFLNGSTRILDSMGESIIIFIGIVLSWLEFLVIGFIFGFFIYTLKKYIDIMDK